MSNTIIFSGSGGQGIMSMGIMLAKAAIEAGKHCIYYPSYGPEQRGGSAKSVVIIDADKPITSPMARYGDILIAMSNKAYVSYIDQLLPGGILIYDSSVVQEKIERDDITLVPVPAGDLALELGSPKVANVLVNGVLLGFVDAVSLEEMQASLDAKFAAKGENVVALNRKALAKGYELASKYKK